MHIAFDLSIDLDQTLCRDAALGVTKLIASGGDPKRASRLPNKEASRVPIGRRISRAHQVKG
jgi:copper homeostasis protein CutC